MKGANGFTATVKQTPEPKLDFGIRLKRASAFDPPRVKVKPQPSIKGDPNDSNRNSV
jgi:hypothetical protein